MHCPACYKDNPPEATQCSFCESPLIYVGKPEPKDKDTDILEDVPVPDASFEADSVFAGRYLIVREIGRGGMAVVYLVRDVLVENDRVSLFQKRGEHPHVCLVTAREKEGVVIPEI